MRTVKTNFKRSGKYFVVSMTHLFEALLISAAYGVAYLYHGMNGRFGKRRLKKPYVYVWRFLTWGNSRMGRVHLCVRSVLCLVGQGSGVSQLCNLGLK